MTLKLLAVSVRVRTYDSPRPSPGGAVDKDGRFSELTTVGDMNHSALATVVATSRRAGMLQ